MFELIQQDGQLFLVVTDFRQIDRIDHFSAEQPQLCDRQFNLLIDFVSSLLGFASGLVVIYAMFNHATSIGGWSLPGFHPHGFLGGLLSMLIFAAKTAFFVWVFVWVRWTLPRFRWDQLMRLGWLFFFEIALVNIFLVAIILAYCHF